MLITVTIDIRDLDPAAGPAPANASITFARLFPAEDNGVLITSTPVQVPLTGGHGTVQLQTSTAYLIRCYGIGGFQSPFAIRTGTAATTLGTLWRTGQIDPAAFAALPVPQTVEQALTAQSVLNAATYLPKWKPNTFYAAATIAANPSGQIVRRKADGTSTTVYDPTAWDIVASGASGATTITQQAVQTASFTAAAGNFYPVNASSGNVTVALPASAPGQIIQLKKQDANAASGATSGIVIVSGTINGTTNATIPIRKQGMGKEYLADGSGGWTITLGDLDITQLGATATEPGFVALAGDLSGTAAAPTVPGLAGKVPSTRTVAGKPLSADVTLSKADVGLGNADNTSDATKPVSTAQQTALNAKADLVGGLVPTSQIPSLALNTVVRVAGRAAMLALTSAQVQPGDVAVDTSTGSTRGSYMLGDTDPSVLTNWVLLNAPTDVVTSVNGQSGTVVLGKSDVGLGNVDNTADSSKPVSTAQQAALDLKAPLASPAFTGTPTGISKAHVGLGNVDNTADVSKPLSSAAQAALATKSSPHALTAAVGAWLLDPAPSGAPSFGSGENGLQLIARYLPAGTYDAVALNLTGAGSAGAVFRVAVYSDLNGIPADLVGQSVAIDGTTSGPKQITLAVPFVVPPGGAMIWAGVVVQGGASTRPGFTRSFGQWLNARFASAPTDFGNTYPYGYYQAGVTGAPPTTWAGTTISDSAPRFAFRRSA